LEARYALKDTLQLLGMVRAFQNPQEHPEGAQFDKLSATRQADERLFVGEVVHQTYLDVSELGTEAAAATAVVGGVSDGDFGLEDKRKMRPFNPIFHANRPFIFLIRDRDTGSILFLGRYVSPTPPAAAGPF
jgi:serine protease inhibitor